MALLASLFIAGPAHADINVEPTTTFPTQTTLGDTNIDFNITVENASTDPPAGDEQRTLTLNQVGITPACAQFSASGACDVPELGVFQLQTGAAAATGTSGSCVGDTFFVSEPDAQGRHTITPEQPTVLGPSDNSGPEPSQCTMRLRLLEVTGTPDNDTQPDDGIQTRNGVDAQVTDPPTGRQAFAGNNKLITVFPGQVNLETLSDPNMADGIVAPGVQATDTATITRANPEADPDPTGQITFTLMGPDPDATCTGPVAFGPETVAIDPATGEATAGPTPALNDPGFYNWVATFESGDNNYEDVTAPVGCDVPEERFHLQPPPSIVVEKTAEPLEMPAPGGDFTFHVTVTNDGPHAVEITSLVDDIYGDLNDPANPNVRNTSCAGVATPPRVRLETDPPDDTFTCQFDAEFFGGPGDSQTDVVTAIAVDDFDQEATDDDDAVVTLVQPAAPTVVVDKTADPQEQPAPGGDFTFTVTVTNTSAQAVEITSLEDDIYGDLNDANNPNVSNNTCAGVADPPRVRLETDPPDNEFTCTFDGEFTGDPGDSQTDIVTAVVEDDFGQEATDDDDAVVTLTPPPTIAVDKTVDPESLPTPGGTFTYTVVVTNTSDNPLEITALDDDVYGDLNDAANPNLTNNTCAGVVGTILAPGDTFTCTFDAEFTGTAGDSETDTVTVTGEDEFGNVVTDEDDATVTITGAPEVAVDKTADPESLPAPGGTFTFTVVITNPGPETVTVTSLTDDVYGDLNDPANPDVDNNTCEGVVGTVLGPDESHTCSFDGEFTGGGGDSETDTVTVVVESEDGTEAEDEDDATVTLIPAPEVAVDKTAAPGSRPAPGGTFTFTVVITNPSPETLTVTSLTDDVYGDLNDPANPDVDNNTCVGIVGTVLASGEDTTCTFDGEFTGDGGDSETDTVTVVAEDDFGNEVDDEDDATVIITEVRDVILTPPPTIEVDKTADPTSRPAPGGDFTFTLVVTNTSEDAVTITSLVDDIYGDLNGQGTCAVGAVLPANGGTYTCTFTAPFTGDAGDSQTDVITVVAVDEHGRSAQDSDSAVVTLTEVGPIVIPPAPMPAPSQLPRTGLDLVPGLVMVAGLMGLGLLSLNASSATAGRGRHRRGRAA